MCLIKVSLPFYVRISLIFQDWLAKNLFLINNFQFFILSLLFLSVFYYFVRINENISNFFICYISYWSHFMHNSKTQRKMNKKRLFCSKLYCVIVFFFCDLLWIFIFCCCCFDWVMFIFVLENLLLKMNKTQFRIKYNFAALGRINSKWSQIVDMVACGMCDLCYM